MSCFEHTLPSASDVLSVPSGWLHGSLVEGAAVHEFVACTAAGYSDCNLLHSGPLHDKVAAVGVMSVNLTTRGDGTKLHSDDYAVFAVEESWSNLRN